MFKNYLKIAWRSIKTNKLYSGLNIFGLGAGMAAAILISLWIVDEVSANWYHEDYDQIAMIYSNMEYNDRIFTEGSAPVPLVQELRNLFPDDLEKVVVSSFAGERSLRTGENGLLRRGLFMEDGGMEILGLQLVQGSQKRQSDPNTVYISNSVSKALFGKKSPVGETIRMDENIDLEILGVYKDFPKNSTFHAISFYSSYKTYEGMEGWVRDARDDWNGSGFPIYVKIAPNTNFESVSAKIENTLANATDATSSPELFLHPMTKWHLYPEFENGKALGTGLKHVWMFGTIGVLILLLAIINFVNLNTARSIKRSKEIGIRKAIGSGRGQLVKQFFTETYVIVFFAITLALLLTVLFLPAFNDLANYSLEIPWGSPIFLTGILVFAILTGFLAGCYPAIYLSSFKPVRVLKGLKKNSAKESFFRKGLVTVQFGISIALIIGTILIYQQIDFAKNRPMGYDQNSLIFFQKRSYELRGHFWAMRERLLTSGGIKEMAESSGPVTEMWDSSSGFEWQGKDVGSKKDFITLQVTPEFGETIQWEILQGRDFSRKMTTDTESIVLNEAAVEYMGLENPIDQIIRWEGIDYKVVGVSMNLVMESPFEKVKPTVFTMKMANLPFVTMRMNPALGISESRARVQKVLEGFSPQGEFNIRFANEEFGQKLWREEQTAKLATSLSIMAIFISFLGIFCLSSFMAEQRSKEISIRKILGASLVHILRLMSKDFIRLISLGCAIAFPLAYFFIENWLSSYELKITISWWVFGVVGLLTTILTLLTVSLRSFGVARSNPIKSIRTE